MAFWTRWFRRPQPVTEAPPSPPEPADFPYPLVPVAAGSALQEWRRLRELWIAEGCLPVLVGDGEIVDATQEVISSGDPDEILRDAAAIAADEFFARRRRELQESSEPFGDEPEAAGTTELEPEEFRDADGLLVPIGSWEPSLATRHDPGVFWAGRARPPARRLVYLAKIPTARSWKIPAYLSFGGWNECPGAEDHVAVHRRWNEKYGAEVFSVAGDVVECWVARPPGDRAACEALAREQYLYCNDIVDQGTQTLLALAGALKDADAWFFWWD